jgi:hypothetical protein
LRLHSSNQPINAVRKITTIRSWSWIKHVRKHAEFLSQYQIYSKSINYFRKCNLWTGLRSEAGMVGSNPTQGIDVWCVCAFFLCLCCPVFR